VPHALAETITQSPTESGDALATRADALRAEAWAGEPFLRADEDPGVALAAGTARKRALEDALEEIGEGLEQPSSAWKVRYALLLGLERTLSEKPPHLASGTELRRHQVDALAGMLTELIAAAQKNGNGNGNGNGHADEPAEEDDEPEDELELGPELDDDLPEPLPVEEDPGAVRRYRFQHPTASGKTIAASGFVEAARTEGVLILTHRRLLVDQFRRELTEHGYGSRFHEAVLDGHTAPRP
jgi:ribonuclease E